MRAALPQLQTLLITLLVLYSSTLRADEPEQHVSSPEITILSTMVASFLGEGEWGFAALIRNGDEELLFDTGFKTHTVLNNARLLKKDLSKVEKVILTHFHTDHTGGLLTLREAYRKDNPAALSKVYVARGFFSQRYNQNGEPMYSLPNPGFADSFKTPEAFRAAAEALGITFVVLDGPMEISPGLFLSGPIERIHDEKNVSGGMRLKAPDGELVADTIPESQVLGAHTTKGWLLISGCGHAGIVNASEKLKSMRDQPINLAVGGFHLFRANDEVIDWTANKLNDFGVQKFVGAHCTGAHAAQRIGQLLGLPRADISIGAIGTTIDAGQQITKASID